MQRLPDRLPSRVIIEGVEPEIDGGRFPIKRTVGEEVVVTADIHADGHDMLAAVLRHRHVSEEEWKEVSMEALSTIAGRPLPVTDAGTSTNTPFKHGSIASLPGGAI